MSGIKLTASGKEQALVDFTRQLRRDGIDGLTGLAQKARVGRAALSQILNGKRSGRQTWKHVLPQLSESALFHLKQCSAWNTHADMELKCLEHHRLTECAVEQLCAMPSQQGPYRTTGIDNFLTQ